MVSLGFSVGTEYAHQNQRRFPFRVCWDKEHLPITNTAGALIIRKNWRILCSGLVAGLPLLHKIILGYLPDSAR